MQDLGGKLRLNKRQLSAIKHKKGPLLIIAGAGTGKTTVITERIKWLVAKRVAKPSEILALTFTDKAAREMEERIDVSLPYGYTQMWVMTFHTFGERVLRQEALEIGLDPGYRLMTQAKSIIFFRQNLFKFDLNYFRPLGNPTKFVASLLEHFNRLRDEDVSPNDYLHLVRTQKSKVKSQKLTEDEVMEIEKYTELANAYKKYQELKAKEGVMDFADLISNTLILFRRRKNVLRQYQNRFKYILVDEFQDTNFAQNELSILLAKKNKNITVVGDDDQAIYRWRGAAISNIIQFKKRFPKTKIVVLDKNYRSTQEILDKAHELIQHNNPDRLEVKEKINKKLKADKKEKGDKIEFIFTNRVEEEADEVAKKIKTQKSKLKSSNEEYNWKDFAVLVRANNHADAFSCAFQRLGIPYQFLGPGMLFRKSEVKDLISYLKLLNDFTDSVACYKVLSMPVFSQSLRDLASILAFANKINISLFEAVEVVTSYYLKDKTHWSRSKNYRQYLPNISKKTKEKMAKFTEMFQKHLGLLNGETAGQILYFFLEESGYLEKLTTYRSIKEEKIVLNISKFFQKLKTFEVENEDASVKSVIDFIDMSLELGESPLATDIDWVENDAVNILTIHSAKGLEFPVVFLVNLVTNRFPTIHRREKIPIPEKLIKEILPEGDYHLQEERRLFYVGMTRAEDKLFFSFSKYYGEGKRERKTSPFVFETLKESVFAKKQTNKSKVKQLAILDWKKEKKKDEKILTKPLTYLSYSQISTYKTCPLQYKYRYIINIPTPQSAAASFGTSVHNTLQKFYEKKLKNKKVHKKDLLEILDQEWIPLGYGTSSYEKKMKKRGKKMLESYYKKFYNSKQKPKNLEELFKIRLSANLKIGGKIDRVDEKENGRIEIIDYKTGKRLTRKQVEKDLQMTVYALAAVDKGIYAKDPKDVVLSFIFLESGEKISSTRSEEELKKAKETLLDIFEQINKSKFSAKVGKWCDFCNFRLICEAWR